LKLAVIVPVPVAEGPLKLVQVGVTLVAPDGGPVPTVLVAVTEQSWVVPFASPVTVMGEPGPLALNAPHVAV
jgi:hypothetical protein